MAVTRSILRHCLWAGIVLSGIAVAAPAHAQTSATTTGYPVKTVRMVIPFGTGGSNLISR